MPITDIHLRTFLDRLDAIRENLHLRPLTDREKEKLVAFSTTTPGLINVVYDKPKKKKGRLYTRPRSPYKEEKFKLNFKDSLTVKTRRTYQYNHELKINLPYGKKIYQPVNVLIPLTVIGVSPLTVITKIENVVSEKIIIFSEMIYNSFEKISISTFLKTSTLEALKISTGLKNGLKDKLKIKTPVKSNKIRDRLENQSVYMDDVGEIEEIELIQILGDIDALR